MRQFTKKQWSVLVVVFLLLLTGIGLRLYRKSPRVERVKHMQQELFTGGNLSASERREKMEALRREQEALTPAERRNIAAEMRKRREAELERYAKLPPEEKVKFLDSRIDQMQATRASFQNSGRGSGPGPGNPPGPPQSAEDRERRRKEMLDSTTPEQRALRDLFMKDMNARLAQRGLPSPPWGPRGPR